MRRASSSLGRAVALMAAFCALGVGAGCGRETFDLLPNDAPATAGSGLSAGAANSSGGSGGGGGASGNAGGRGSGKAGALGFGGRVGGFPGGGLGNFPCLGEGGCPDEEPSFCSQSSPFCFPCFGKNDCALLGDAKVCDPDLKRCVQCRRDADCGVGEGCNPNTWRCAKSCASKDGCVLDSLHLFCSSELGVCVSCNKQEDCGSYGPFNARCYLNACVECFEDRQCTSQLCVSGRCINKH